MTLPHDTSEKEAVPDVLPPVLSEADVNTWEIFDTYENPRGDYAKARLVEKAQTRSLEIAQFLFDFGARNKDLVPSVFEAAPLVELQEKLGSSDPIEARHARMALKSYDSGNQQHQDYVRAISGDIREIKKFVKDHFKKALRTYEPEYEENLNPWNYDLDIIPLRDVVELISEEESQSIKKPKGVNLESMLIAAASAYNTLRNSDDFTEHDVLQTIYAVEKFYRPFLSFIGFDGVDMALEHEVERVRMKHEASKMTEGDFELARGILEQAGLTNREEVVKLVGKIMSHLFPAGADAESALHNSSGHTIQVGIGHIYGQERIEGKKVSGKKDNKNVADDTIEYNWRVKTERSIVENLLKHPGEYISDLLGITVKVPANAYDMLADKMAIALGTLSELVSSQPKNSASRDTHIHARGKDVIKALIPVLEQNLDGFEWHIETRDSTNGYQVAKITLLHTESGIETPVELMFQTVADRNIARFGTAAHINKFKDKKYTAESDDEVRFSEQVNDRKSMLNVARLTDQSTMRAENLFNRPEKNKKDIATAGIRYFVSPE